MSTPNFTKAEYEAFLHDRKLMGSHCLACGAVFLPPRPLCSACYGEELEWMDVGASGTLVAFTAVHIAPTNMILAGYGRERPYVSGIVKLDSGPSISAQITGVDANQPDAIAIGSPVAARFIERETGDGVHSFLVFDVISHR